MDSPLKQPLLSVGFSEKETNVYLSLLELGKGTVSEIARRANINRTTGYDILDSLVQKGLASISGKKPKQQYNAESPDKIRNYLQKELERQTHFLTQVDTLIPKLKSMHNVQDRPQIRFYEGTEGLKEVYEDTLTSHETIRAYASVNETQSALPNYFPTYYKRRFKKGIGIRAIFPYDAAAVERIKHNKAEGRETALVPADAYAFSPEINIYDNKIMIASWKERLGIIIESTEISDAMKKIFELSWAQAKNLEKTIKKQSLPQ